MIPMTLEQVARAMGAPCEPPWPAGRVIRVTTDSRAVQPGDLFFAIRGERFDGHAFVGEAVAKGAVACVVDRDADRTVDGANLVVADTVAALGALAHHYRREVMSNRTVVVAVTGSNGKTTTKCMIDHVLGDSLPGRAAPKSFNNQLGVPLTLLSVEADDRYVVVEIGANAPGEVASLAALASPEVAVITSIGEAHLEGLGDVAAIAREKACLLDHVLSPGLRVVNVDEPAILGHLDRGAGARLVTFGLDRVARVRIGRVLGALDGSTFELEDRYCAELSMPGLHHATNAAAAFVVARWFGLAPESIMARLKSFVPPAGRTRRVEIGGVTIIDDTYNANPTSMMAAIATLVGARLERNPVSCSGSMNAEKASTPGNPRGLKPAARHTKSHARLGPTSRRILVMGDMLELGERTHSLHTDMIRAAVSTGIDALLVVGTSFERAARACRQGMTTTPTIICADADSAADRLGEMLSPGDAVWIKGSRVMGLDRIVDRLKKAFGSAEAVAKQKSLSRRSADAQRSAEPACEVR